MIATFTVCTNVNRPVAEPNFLAMLPIIRRSARFAFRHLRHAVREDLLSETVAHAFAAFVRLVELGKAAVVYPSALARYAIRRVRSGRRVGTKQNAHDVLSDFAQRRQGFSVEPLSDREAHGDWELLTANRRADPGQIACCRIDFRAWLEDLPRFKHDIALSLASGITTTEAAQQFKLSRARISQLRNELAGSWRDFQAEPAGT